MPQDAPATGTTPYAAPTEPTAQAAIAAIAEDLAVFDDWMDRYEFIIDLGRKLPPFPQAWMDDAHRVPGCQSKVWMHAIRDGDRLMLAGASDAAIVSGLVALLLRVYSGRSPAEILATDPVFLKELGLLEALSTNRGNGIASMARAIRERAAAERHETPAAARHETPAAARQETPAPPRARRGPGTALPAPSGPPGWRRTRTTP
jgi:cysteine desulfuration protein SufE